MVFSGQVKCDLWRHQRARSCVRVANMPNLALLLEKSLNQVNALKCAQYKTIAHLPYLALPEYVMLGWPVIGLYYSATRAFFVRIRLHHTEPAKCWLFFFASTSANSAVWQESDVFCECTSGGPKVILLQLHKVKTL